MSTKTIWTADEIAGVPFPYSHPLDEGAASTIHALSKLTGLTRTGVNLVRIAPGMRAFPFHRHHSEEEWAYVISGTAELRSGEETHTLKAGAFVAFPAGGPAHCMTNSGTEELVCLMGGESRDAEIVDFPDLDKRLTRSPAGVEIQPLAAAEPFDFFARSRPPGGGE